MERSLFDYLGSDHLPGLSTCFNWLWDIQCPTLPHQDVAIEIDSFGKTGARAKTGIVGDSIIHVRYPNTTLLCIFRDLASRDSSSQVMLATAAPKVTSRELNLEFIDLLQYPSWPPHCARYWRFCRWVRSPQLILCSLSPLCVEYDTWHRDCNHCRNVSHSHPWLLIFLIRTYKIKSIWSMVTPFVSGRKKKAQVLAINIHVAKKNQVPNPNDAKIYGKALVMMNWTALKKMLGLNRHRKCFRALTIAQERHMSLWYSGAHQGRSLLIQSMGYRSARKTSCYGSQYRLQWQFPRDNLQDWIDHDHWNCGLSTCGRRCREFTSLSQDGRRVPNFHVWSDKPKAHRACYRRNDDWSSTTDHVNQCDIVDDGCDS